MSKQTIVQICILVGLVVLAIFLYTHSGRA